MTKRRNSVSFNGFTIPVRHAHYGYLAGEAYKYFFSKKQKMSPIMAKVASRPFHDESYGGVGITSESWVNVSARNPPLKRVTKNNISYRDSYAAEFSWVSNTQRFVSIYALGSKEQYNDSTADTQFNRSTSFYAPAFQLQTDERITGSSLITPGDHANKWIGFKNATIYLDFLNHTTLPAFIKVHWFKSLTDTNDITASGSFADAVGDNNPYIFTWVGAAAPGSAPQQSGAETVISNTNGSATAYASLVTLPYTNLQSRKDVFKNWQHLKTKTFTLQNGASHRMTVSHMLNMFQGTSRLDDLNRYPKGCISCIIEMQGAPSHLREAIATPTYDGPTIGAGKISVVVNRKVNLRPLKNSQDRFDTTYIGRGNVVSLGTVPNTNIIQDADMQTDQAETLQ